MIQSRLTPLAYFYTFLILSFPAISVYFIIIINDHTKGDWSWGTIAITAFLLIVSLMVIIWGFFVEMNMRMSVVKIYEDRIIIKQLMGYGTKLEFTRKELDGFVVKSFRTRGSEQEYLYLIKNKRPMSVFSSLYFKNYAEIKHNLSQDLKQYGI